MFCDFFSSTQGSFIFHQVVGREGGWWDLRGRHEKNGFKGGVRIKNSGFKGGGGYQKIPSNFAVTAFVMMQKAYQNAKISKILRVFAQDVPYCMKTNVLLKRRLVNDLSVCRQLKLKLLSTQINIHCLMTNQTPALLVQRAP